MMKMNNFPSCSSLDIVPLSRVQWQPFLPFLILAPSVAVMFNQGNFAPSAEICQCLETFFVVTAEDKGTNNILWVKARDPAIPRTVSSPKR